MLLLLFLFSPLCYWNHEWSLWYEHHHPLIDDEDDERLIRVVFKSLSTRFLQFNNHNLSQEQQQDDDHQPHQWQIQVHLRLLPRQTTIQQHQQCHQLVFQTIMIQLQLQQPPPLLRPRHTIHLFHLHRQATAWYSNLRHRFQPTASIRVIPMPATRTLLPTICSHVHRLPIPTIWDRSIPKRWPNQRWATLPWLLQLFKIVPTRNAPWMGSINISWINIP